MTQLAIGVSGEVAAGKTTAAKILRNYGFAYTRISKFIDTLVPKEGEKPDRELHQALGWQLHVEKGQAWLCERTIDLLPNGTNAFVLDGIRWNDDVEYLRQRYGNRFIHLHVSAPEAVRKLRFEQEDKGIAYEDVISHPVEQEVGSLAGSADILILNDGSREAFLLDVVGRILERHLNAR